MTDRPPAGDKRWVAGTAAAVGITGVGVLLLGLWLGGGRPWPTVPGLPDAGPIIGWALPIAKLTMDVAAVGTVGFLVLGVALIPRPGAALGEEGARCVCVAGRLALLWSVAAAATLVLAVSDVLGIAVREVLSGPTLIRYAWSIDASRALIPVLAITGIIAVTAPMTRRQRGGAALVLLGLGGLVPLAFAGHSAPAAAGGAATASLAVHVVAVALWVGGLAGIVLRRRTLDPVLAVVVPRFSALAFWCFVVVAVSGVANAWLRLGTPPGLWWSGYGLLVVGKLAALVALGGFGWWHRRDAVRTIAARRTHPAFVRFAAGEVVVMAAAIGLAVALSRTPTPHL